MEMRKDMFQFWPGAIQTVMVPVLRVYDGCARKRTVRCWWRSGELGAARPVVCNYSLMRQGRASVSSVNPYQASRQPSS